MEVPKAIGTLLPCWILNIHIPIEATNTITNVSMPKGLESMPRMVFCFLGDIGERVGGDIGVVGGKGGMAELLGDERGGGTGGRSIQVGAMGGELMEIVAMWGERVGAWRDWE